MITKLSIDDDAIISSFVCFAWFVWFTAKEDNKNDDIIVNDHIIGFFLIRVLVFNLINAMLQASF